MRACILVLFAGVSVTSAMSLLDWDFYNEVGCFVQGECQEQAIGLSSGVQVCIVACMEI